MHVTQEGEGASRIPGDEKGEERGFSEGRGPVRTFGGHGMSAIQRRHHPVPESITLLTTLRTATGSSEESHGEDPRNQ